MYSSLSHQVVAEMCLEIAQHMYKAATLAGNVAEEIMIAQVVDTYVWKLFMCTDKQITFKHYKIKDSYAILSSKLFLSILPF